MFNVIIIAVMFGIAAINGGIPDTDPTTGVQYSAATIRDCREQAWRRPDAPVFPPAWRASNEENWSATQRHYDQVVECLRKEAKVRKI